MPAAHSGNQAGRAAAIVRVQAPSGKRRCFEADIVEINGPYVTVTGRWRDDKQRKRRTYTWTARLVLEINYAEEEETS